jgi:hypothetical protein
MAKRLFVHNRRPVEPDRGFSAFTCPNQNQIVESIVVLIDDEHVE